MNTLHKMREYLLELYLESLKKYPLTEDDENRIIGLDEMTENDKDRLLYIVELLSTMSVSEKEEFLSLLLLYYYIISYTWTDDESEFDEEDEEIDINDLIETTDKEELLEYFESDDCEEIFDVIWYILEADIMEYAHSNETKINNFDEYLYLQDAVRDRGFNPNTIFEKLHPDFQSESLRYDLFEKDENLIKKYGSMKPKNCFDFVQMFQFLKQSLEYEEYLEDFISKFLDTNKDNKDLLIQINLFMLKYCYVKKYLENEEDYDIEISKRVQNIKEIDQLTIKEFMSFDFSFWFNYSSLPEEIKNRLDEIINLDNNKNYGNEGIWRRYDDREYDNLSKYAPSWIDKIKPLKNKYNIYIYYSINDKGEYTIPRLCLFYDGNKVIDALGRRDLYNIELDIIDILDDKVQENDYDSSFMNNILTLKFLKYLKEKIDNGQCLNRTEFEFLYGLDGNINPIIFNKYDNLINELSENKNIRRLLANYYQCDESEVALTKDELNENTVVTKIFYPVHSNCCYPKLRIIFGNAYGNYLHSATGISSIEYIKGDAEFDYLTSSEGLDNLIYIGGNAFFSSMEDTSYLNDNLEIVGNKNFKNGFEPPRFQKKI